MSDWLQKLQNKPEKTRHAIALGVSISTTCLIFVMWVTVLNFGSSNLEPGMQAVNPSSQTASPLSAFSSNAASAFKQLKTGFSAIGDDSRLTPLNGANSGDFWGDSTEPQSGMADDSSSMSKDSSSEPFTSRNYSPNQESEWFNQ